MPPDYAKLIDAVLATLPEQDRTMALIAVAGERQRAVARADVVECCDDCNGVVRVE